MENMLEIAEMPESLASLGLIASVSLNTTENKVYLYLIRAMLSPDIKETIKAALVGNPMIELMLKGAIQTLKEKAGEAQTDQGAASQGTAQGPSES